MKLAIMQPYLFPYIGYFQLVASVDKFVFYDDVQFIKGGWINRNYILENGENKQLITLHLEASSSNKKINEIRVKDNSSKLLKTIELNYCKAPFFENVFPFIEEVFSQSSWNPYISEIASLSVRKTAEYLGMSTVFENSSFHYSETINLGRVKRLTQICRIEKAEIYTNPFGGKNLYTKEEFQNEGIKLYFIKPGNIQYVQFKEKFVPNLSIIDVIMFNSPANVGAFLKDVEFQ